MARPKYTIAATDAGYVRDYLTTQLQINAMNLGDVSYTAVQKELADACSPRSKEEKAKLLGNNLRQ